MIDESHQGIESPGLDTPGLIALHGRRSSYIVDLFGGRYPTLLHWGGRISAPGGERVSAPPFPYRVAADPADPATSLEALPLEYGLHGAGDFRRPALHGVTAQGYPIPALAYRRHTVERGAGGGATPPGPANPGAAADIHAALPRVHAPAGGSSAERLRIELADDHTGLAVTLVYLLLEELDVVVRSVEVRNEGAEAITLDRVMSASIDLPRGSRELVALTGSWAWERQLDRQPLSTGVVALESTRGMSSHGMNPAFLLCDPAATEASGEVHGFALAYSGNWLSEIDTAGGDSHRVNMGIHPFELAWRLEPGERFATPEAVLVYSSEGLGGASERMHAFVEECVVPPRWRRRERPVLLNSWEAQYFHISHGELVELAESGRDLGVELFVVDDGWFGGRDDDTSSLGDWQENSEKLPRGLEGLAADVHALGMQFGLWVEPEAVSPKSELHASHPEWCLHIPGRPRPEGRNELILDLTRTDVQDWIIETFADLFRRAAVDYVKWDMNRALAPAVSAALPPERRGESAHRYVLGLYRVLRHLTEAFPHVLFEGCAGGGGRFDLGMLAFTPQIWTSDNTDAISRARIQYGTSLFYPQSTMGSHVSAVPNHQLGRTTPMHTRGIVAMAGVLGYELDVRKLEEEDRAAIRGQIDFYRKHRQTLQYGTFRRLLSPFGGAASGGGYGTGGHRPGAPGGHGSAAGVAPNQAAAWMVTSQDGTTVLVSVVHILSPGESVPPRLRLRGLAPEAVYEDVEEERSYTGAELMERGVPLTRYARDFDAALIELRRRD
jgi:alpha-galactosidase